MASLTKIKEGKYWELFSDGGTGRVIKLKNVRVSFPAVGTQKEDEGEDGEKSKSWQITPMLEKGIHDEAKAQCRKLIDQLLLDNGTEKNGTKVALKMEAQYIALKDGDEKDRPEYENHWIISAKEGSRHPTARTAQGDLIMNDAEIDKVFYGGCYCNVMIRFWFFGGTSKRKPGKTYPKRICAGFVGVQFLRNGDPFGEGRIDDSDAWGAEEEGEDDGLGRTSKPTTNDEEEF